MAHFFIGYYADGHVFSSFGFPLFPMLFSFSFFYFLQGCCGIFFHFIVPGFADFAVVAAVAGGIVGVAGLDAF